MPQSRRKRSPDSELRRKAEEHLSSCTRKEAAPSLNVAEMERLIHELEVHQIELEMQNEELKQSRAEMEAGLDRYTDLYDFAPVGYFTLSRDGTIIQVNLTGTRLLGIERSKLVNRRFGMFIAAESRLVLNNLLEKVFSSEAKASCVSALSVGNNPTWVSIEAIAAADRQECRAVVTDISELKQIESEREATIEFLHLIRKADSTKELIRTALVFFKRLSGCEEVDLRLEDGGIPAVSRHESQAVLPLLVNGKQIGRVQFVDNRKEMFPAGQAAFWGSLADSLAVAIAKISAEEKVCKNERRFKLLSETADLLLKAEDPRQRMEELCRELMDHLDCQAFFSFLVDEDTGRLRLNAYAGIPEEAAKKVELLNYGEAVSGNIARDKFRIVIENILDTPDPLAKLIRSLGIQAYACHPLMASREKLIGTLSFGTRTRPHFSPDEIDLMKTVADQLAMAIDRIGLIHALQRSREHLELRVKERTAELVDAGESIRRYAGKLKKMNRNLEEFLYVAAHHLQEPLRKIMTFSDRLDQGKELLGSFSKDIKRVHSSAARMRELIHDLSEYSRIGMEAKHSKNVENVDLNRVLEDILSGIGTIVREAAATIKIENLPAVEADVKMIDSLFKHLLINALKFRSGRPPEIKISGKARDNGEGDEILTILIEDNGIGFEEKYLDRIFTPFQQLHGRGEYEGNGIGLSICRKVVETLGGRITAESRPGEGSTFKIDLPVKNRSRSKWS